MRHSAGFLALVCIVVVLINEAVRIRYGFMSNRHFVLFWGIWALVLMGMAASVGLLLIEALTLR